MSSFKILMVTVLLLSACRKPPVRVSMLAGAQTCLDSDENCSETSGEENAERNGTAGGSPGFGLARIWRLTPIQFSKTLTALFKKDYAVESKFGSETRPAAGFGIDSAVLKLDSTYASNVSSILEGITKDNKELLTYTACKTYESFTDACLKSFIKDFGAKAFRRPLTEEELKRYEAIYTAVKPGLGAAEAIGAVAEGLVRSPYTNFRFEIGVEGSSASKRKLSGPELASALAFATTNAPPDDALLKLGENDEILKDKVYASEVDRMMAKPEFNELFVEFMMRFTGVNWLANLKKQTAYPIYTDAVSAAMATEVKDYVGDNISKNKANFKSLLVSTKTTISSPLAEIYGLPAFTGSKAIDVKVAERPGLINLPGVISANSPANHSGPVQRGIFLLQKFMCFTPPPPPAEASTELPNVDASKSLRERFAEHEKNPTRAGCHQYIDPPGFAYETFDAIGRFREKDDHGAPVEPPGKIKLGDKEVSFKNSADLALELAESNDVHECFSGHVFDYLMGRVHDRNDQVTLKAATQAFKDSSLDMRAVFKTIYLSDSFRFRKGE